MQRKQFAAILNVPALAFALVALAACKPAMPPEQHALLELMANRSITCVGNEDCGRKWGLALGWVQANSQTGMRNVTDDLIVTNVMSGEGKGAVKYPEFTVVRNQMAPGMYALHFTSYCEHGFVCGTNTLKLRAEFTNAVMGLPAGVTQTAPNAYRVRPDRLNPAQ